MRVFQLLALLSLFALCSFSLLAQQPSPSPTAPVSTEAVTLLQQSLAAQTGGAAITDMTLKGTVTFMFGTQTEADPITFTALSGGSSQIVIDRPTGTETEIWSTSTGSPIITGTSPSGLVSQPAGGSITMPSPAWLSPSVLTSLLSGSGYSSTYIGSETRNGSLVNHVAARQTPAQGSTVASFIAKQVAQQAQTDIYLDPPTSAGGAPNRSH